MFGTRHGMLLPVAVLATAFAACSHTKVVSTWRDPGHQRTPRKVLVHAMAMSPTVKDLFENLLAQRLKERGVDAQVSHEVLPDSTEFDKAAMKKVVLEQGIDAVFIAHAVDKKVVESLGPGRVSYNEVAYFDADGGFVLSAASTGYMPGIRENEVAYAEFILYDVPARKRVWVLQTKTFVLNTQREEVQPAVDLVMERLRSDTMIP